MLLPLTPLEECRACGLLAVGLNLSAGVGEYVLAGDGGLLNEVVKVVVGDAGLKSVGGVDDV